MNFEKLTHEQLKILKSKGYNILTSNQKLTDEKVVWFPERVEDVCEYLIGLDTVDFPKLRLHNFTKFSSN